MNKPCYNHGANSLGDKTRFRLWAPFCDKVELLFENTDGESINSYLMDKDDEGFFETIQSANMGDLYRFKITKSNQVLIRPDPASRFQPKDVHSASQIIDHNYYWTDNEWRGLSPENYIAYELHVGTFTSESTFEAIIQHLDELKELGITVIELMPVSQFPGNRNWGYDGVYPFAVQNSYGGPTALKKFINTCHEKSMAVILDVVYNHLGPEGNYLHDFGPYFTSHYQTPWGMALNFDDADCGPVRSFFVENALYWVSEFHIDALRLDAVHAIHDESAYSILEEITDTIHNYAAKVGRRIHIIAESDLNNPKLIYPKELGGYAMDAQWNDDFHHALHTLLTKENNGYYSDFGKLEDLNRCLDIGYTYSGNYSQHRKRNHGRKPLSIKGPDLWVYSQNHDQIGNRMLGERLHHLVTSQKHLLAAGITILSPYTPMLFMGEEYAEKSSFQYFISHSDAALIQAVRNGRKKEFESFNWHDCPDPQDPKIFDQCKLDHSLKEHGIHQKIYHHYKTLIAIRKKFVETGLLNKKNLTTVIHSNNILQLTYKNTDSALNILFNFNEKTSEIFHNDSVSDIIYWSTEEHKIEHQIKSYQLEPFSFIVLFTQKI